MHKETVLGVEQARRRAAGDGVGDDAAEGAVRVDDVVGMRLKKMCKLPARSRDDQGI